MIDLAVSRVGELALVGKLQGEVGVDSQGRQQLGVLEGAEAAHVGVGQRRAAVRRRRWRLRRSHRRLARHQIFPGHVAYGLRLRRRHHSGDGYRRQKQQSHLHQLHFLHKIALEIDARNILPLVPTSSNAL